MKKKPSEMMREMRLRNGLSKRQLGWALGYRMKPDSLDTQIKRWECGHRPIPTQVRLLVEYMTAYGIPPDWYKGVQ